jgi:hypothetical protein
LLVLATTSARACSPLQVSTAEGFKLMKKGADAHDRALLFSRFPLLARLQDVASGAEGKVAMPGVGKGGVRKGGDPAAGRNMMTLFAAVDLMHPFVPGAELRSYQGAVPTCNGDFSVHTRDRKPPGARWFPLWTSAGCGNVVTLEYVGLKMAGKIPPSTSFSVLVGGLRGRTEVVHLAEEKVSTLSASKGELVLVSDGQTPSGQVLGNLLQFDSVVVELFEPERGSQMIPLAEVNIRLLERPSEAPAAELDCADAQSAQGPYESVSSGG